MVRLLVLMTCIWSVVGCGVLQEKKSPPEANMQIAKEAVQHPLSPEETEAMMSDVASNWFYGQGLGETMLAAGTIFVFPPYAIYLAGNAALSFSGYEELRISQALPDSGEDIWNSVYDGVTSVPGQLTATVAGEEFVTKRAAENTLARYLKRDPLPSETQDSVKTWR